MVSNLTEREEFEKWYETKHFPYKLARSADYPDKYSSTDTTKAWEVWQARALLEKESAASAVPAWQPLLEEVRKINADYDDFDGDRRGIAEALYQAKESLIEAMLAAATTVESEK